MPICKLTFLPLGREIQIARLEILTLTLAHIHFIELTTSHLAHSLEEEKEELYPTALFVLATGMGLGPDLPSGYDSCRAGFSVSDTRCKYNIH